MIKDVNERKQNLPYAAGSVTEQWTEERDSLHNAKLRRKGRRTATVPGFTENCGFHLRANSLFRKAAAGCLCSAAIFREKYGICLLALLLLLSFSASGAPGNKRLDNARDFVLYYGGVNAGELENLARYDVVIIDPQAMGGNAKQKIAELKRRGCFVIGYLSYMEVAAWHRYRKKVPAEWELKINGKPWKPWGNNHAIDLGNPQWRKLLVKLTKTEVMDYGCDGVFMDTLADIEHPDLPEPMRKKQLAGLEALMKELRAKYPGFAFVGNWTIQATLPVMAKYADVICWENFQPKYFDPADSAYAFMMAIKKNLDRLQKKHRFKVYALWASPNYYNLRDDQKKMAELAASFGYLSYCCIDDYHAPLTRKK